MSIHTELIDKGLRLEAIEQLLDVMCTSSLIGTVSLTNSKYNYGFDVSSTKCYHICTVNFQQLDSILHATVRVQTEIKNAEQQQRRMGA